MSFRESREKAGTVAHQLAQTFSCHPKFPITYEDAQGRFKNRVATHDTMHLLLIDRAWPVNFMIMDEYGAAIVQAVLTRDLGTSYNNFKQWQSAPEIPSLDDIKAKTLPAIPKFMTQVLGDWCMKPPEVFPEVSEDFVQKHYLAARMFDRAFTERYDRPFCQVSAEELMQMEFAPLKQMFQQAARAAGLGLKKPEPMKGYATSQSSASRAMFGL